MVREHPDSKVKAYLERLIKAGFLFYINNVSGGICAPHILAVNILQEDYEGKREITVVVPYDDSVGIGKNIGLSFHYEDPGKEPKLRGFEDISYHHYVDIKLTDGSIYRIFERPPKINYYPCISEFLANIREKLEREGSFFNTSSLNEKGKFLPFYKVLNPRERR